MSPRIALLLAALALAVLAPAAPLMAQEGPQRVAVGRFGGPQSARIRALLIQNLEENGLEVVDVDEVVAVAERLLDGGRIQEDDYPVIARELQIAAFLDGRVRRARRRWTLRVTVRNGADGLRLGGRSWGGRTIRSLRAVRRNGHARLQEYLALAQTPAPAVEAQETVADPNADPWYASGEEEVPPEGEGEGDDEEEEPSDDGGDLGYRPLRFGLLAGTLRRSMQSTVEVDSAYRSPYMAGGTITEDREYTSGGLGHMELGLMVDLFPGAFLDEPVVPWLGMRFRYRHSVLLESQGPGCIPNEEPPVPAGEPVARGARCPSDDPSFVVPVETTQQELYVGAAVDANVGSTARGPWLQLDLGYGFFHFVLDPDDLSLLRRQSIVPPLRYSYVQIGAGLRYMLHEVFGVAARFGYRFGLGVGDDAKRIWGTKTNEIGGFTVAGDLVFDLSVLKEGIFATVGVEFFRFTTRFRGQTACRVLECADYELWEPWPQEGDDVSGGFDDPVDDSYLRLSIALGYAFQ
ncbi:MAG TPA: hypothetical protein RMH85_09390 [Polyangiaceae bacterium LLY-WYZ-15_(1-7)]|nr:hypothetical protein [Myxococcales bacterium]MAT28615.1 hypothetical protein [Sandaracinus sp.]HJK93674.1 hypothetical protein [Polyangiaceae bacterium LLY-WYZ-15_(1-7)]MBJ71956.1 hypothetical protein [Sandaracinus sp.]HJL01660.1 hypothetical protein [Polyangiaceae bacterium LLY-WYZ-15_(1-7)]